MFTVEINNQQSLVQVDETRMRRAISAILAEEGFTAGTVSVAVVDDQQIHVLNRQYLEHDYPTDVLSFLLEEQDDQLEGEVIVGAETAQRNAPQFDATAETELLLYVIHGTLHLAGYDDHLDADRQEMREREQHYLSQAGQPVTSARDGRSTTAAKSTRPASKPSLTIRESES